MAVAMLLEMPGVTQEQYDRVMQELDLHGMPEGGIAHISAPMEGGWRVLDVWESQEQFERFATERLMPAAQKASVEIPPPKFAPVHNVLTGAAVPSPAA